ncbi:MAG: serine hydrolase [Acidimicrobiales bacterium]
MTGWLHAIDIDRGHGHHDGGDCHEVDVGADEVVVLASVFKVPLLVALHRAADAGELRLDQRVRITSAKRASGAAGLGVMHDDAELSLRDLAMLMITISDNTAADVVLEQVGLDAVNETIRAVGLANTRVVASTGDLSSALADDFIRSGLSASRALADQAALLGFRALDPDTTNYGTPRDMTTLLARIWRDEAASPAACSEMRRALRLQVFRHRLAKGFAGDGARVAGKTGTVLNVRSEIGVVGLPDGHRYAVAVFTRSDSTAPTDTAADTAIGTAARLAVEQLRRDSQ